MRTLTLHRAAQNGRGLGKVAVRMAGLQRCKNEHFKGKKFQFPALLQCRLAICREDTADTFPYFYSAIPTCWFCSQILKLKHFNKAFNLFALTMIYLELRKSNSFL